MLLEHITFFFNNWECDWDFDLFQSAFTDLTNAEELWRECLEYIANNFKTNADEIKGKALSYLEQEMECEEGEEEEVVKEAPYRRSQRQIVKQWYIVIYILFIYPKLAL